MVASDAVERLSSWMTRAYREAGGIASLPLNELALPGSHNSASYAITSCSTVPAGDLGDSIRPFLKVPPVSAVISRWTKVRGVPFVWVRAFQTTPASANGIRCSISFAMVFGISMRAFSTARGRVR